MQACGGGEIFLPEAMPRPTTALIVDDESHVRMFVRLLLKEAGIVQTW